MYGQLWPWCTLGTSCNQPTNPTFACEMLSDKMNKILLINVRIKLPVCITIGSSEPAVIKGISECKVCYSSLFLNDHRCRFYFKLIIQKSQFFLNSLSKQFPLYLKHRTIPTIFKYMQLLLL